MRTGDFLAGVPVLAGLSDELLERLAAEVTEIGIRAGHWVLREGEPAHSMFIVASGRVAVLDEGPPEALLRTLRRGDVLGELALLREGVRSASARALRDTQLLELGRESFERLIETAPGFALGLTRTLGAQLAASRTPVAVSTPPRTIAVIGLDPGVAVHEVATALADELERHGTVARLQDGELETLHQAEADRDRLVLWPGADADEEWLELCVHESDLIVALTRGQPDPKWLSRATALEGCEQLVLGRTRAIPDLKPRQLQVVSDSAQVPAALAALARRLAGRSLGVVLSGGGARALAHIGVLDELRAAGLQIDRIGGVSLGALVAAAVAGGTPQEEMYVAAQRYFVDSSPSTDFVPPVYSILRGSKTRRLLREFFGDRRIEELPRRFFCMSCDLIAREPVLHRTGPIVDAVYPSLAIPAIFPPAVTADGRLLVDGGVLDNLPVAEMARTGEGPVIAVDVTARGGRDRHSGRGLAARVESPLRRVLTGSDGEIPRLTETMIRTMLVGSADVTLTARQHADLVITPAVDGVGLMEWKALPTVRELGRRAAREALAAANGAVWR
ncbi:MAG TPA: patatin-like phospholipase family protein [Solirubrobacteraceae bacterium]|nr:patatin-like phospholipase family protein [Solirubrobacteraceae bacterium]